KSPPTPHPKYLFHRPPHYTHTHTHTDATAPFQWPVIIPAESHTITQDQYPTRRNPHQYTGSVDPRLQLHPCQICARSPPEWAVYTDREPLRVCVCVCVCA